MSGPPPEGKADPATQVQLNYLDDIKDLFGNNATTSGSTLTFQPGELGFDYDDYPTIDSVSSAKAEAILLVILREALDSALAELVPCMEIKRTFVLKTVGENKQILGEQFTVKIFSAQMQDLEGAVDPNTL